MSCCSSLCLHRRGWQWHVTVVCRCLASNLRLTVAIQTSLDVRGVNECVNVFMPFLFFMSYVGSGEK